MPIIVMLAGLLLIAIAPLIASLAIWTFCTLMLIFIVTSILSIAAHIFLTPSVLVLKMFSTYPTYYDGVNSAYEAAFNTAWGWIGASCLWLSPVIIMGILYVVSECVIGMREGFGDSRGIAFAPEANTTQKISQATIDYCVAKNNSYEKARIPVKTVVRPQLQYRAVCDDHQWDRFDEVASEVKASTHRYITTNIRTAVVSYMIGLILLGSNRR